jgi:ABC-type lipoprotein release transport system permease subunit
VEAGSRDLAPDFPGISDTDSLSSWDPPFPLDLRRVRRVDEDYWDRYRTTPKAFIALDVAHQLWGSRYGSLTSVRLGTRPDEPVASAVERVTHSLDAMVDPETFGLVPRDVRSEGLAASRGATDFGEYFVYFSFFIVVSALVLVVLFFKLGVEQRAREVGLLRAVGLSPRSIRRLFTAEGLLLALLGSLIGTGAAVAYAWLLMRALTTWWVDAVGTTSLTLHVSFPSLAAGAAAGVLAAVICVWWTLRGLRRVSERTLLAGDVATAMEGRSQSKFVRLAAVALTGIGATMAVLATLGVMPAAGGFFGAGAVLLVAALTFASLALRLPARRPIAGHGWPSVSHLATRNASHRPGRSVLSMAVIASATFILVTVDAFRRDTHVDGSDRHAGTGGYQLMVQTLLPIVHDPNSETGRDALNLGSLDRSTTIEPFRVRPGDDASCLNLYQPTSPRIVAPRDTFLTEGRFSFQRAASTTDAERANPWLLLNRVEPDGAIPVIADANSMTYVLHKAVGDDLAMTAGGRPVTLRFVGALSDSIFQSEVLMSERNFIRVFPEQDGFRLLLVDTSAEAGDVAKAIEQGMSDAGADAVQTGEYLASFHRVENTYLSTFQALGGLGLLLGTVGLATVLLRNVLERRRELALLAAVGYRPSHFLVMAAAENLLIVCGGLAAGAVCAAIAIAPAVAERGGRLPLSAGALLLLFSVLVVAMLSSLTAMAAVAKSPLLESLRSE